MDPPLHVNNIFLCCCISESSGPDNEHVGSLDELEDVLRRIKDPRTSSSSFSSVSAGANFTFQTTSPSSTSQSVYSSPRNSLSSLYQPSIEDIDEDKLLEVAQGEAQEATPTIIRDEKPFHTSAVMKPFRAQHLRPDSDEGVHSDGEITGGVTKPLHPSLRKPFQTMKPRRNCSTGNLKDPRTISFDKQKTFLGKRSISVPEINRTMKVERPVISYTVAHDKNKRTLTLSNLKVSDLPMTLTSRNYVYVQCDTIPMDMKRKTEKQLLLNDIDFQDDLVFTEMDESEFSKVTILMTVHNVNEEKKKGTVMAEVAFPLSRIHFRDQLPVPMKQNLQTGKRLKRVKQLTFLNIKFFYRKARYSFEKHTNLCFTLLPSKRNLIWNPKKHWKYTESLQWCVVLI